MGKEREIAEQWFEAIEKGETDAAVRLLSPDVEFISPAGTMKGHDQVRPFLDSYVQGFPGATFNLRNVWEWEGTAVVEGTYSGENSGPMMTPDGRQMPATGKWVDLPYVTVLEIENGTIRSQRVYWDQVGFMTQLGMMEAPPGS